MSQLMSGTNLNQRSLGRSGNSWGQRQQGFAGTAADRTGTLQARSVEANEGWAVSYLGGDSKSLGWAFKVRIPRVHRSLHNRRMEIKLQVVIVPVSDVERAKAFYAGTLGFALDVDYAPAEDF